MTKIYFAGAEHEQFRQYLDKHNIKHRLFSYFYIKEKNIKLKATDFLDSGAFSAMNSGKKIDLDKYIAYIKKHKIKLYANLDVIGNAKASLKNLNYMIDKGLTPIPVFHINEDFKYLEEYCKNFTYIALGGLAQLRIKRLCDNWLKKCFNIINKYKTKVHGFAVTSSYYIKRFPFYSVDSTTWLGGNKFGTFFQFTKGEMTVKDIKTKRNWKKLLDWNLSQWKNFANYMEGYHGNRIQETISN